jgi:predicted ATP-grasp superfamily ATP-dependent carboligase
VSCVIESEKPDPDLLRMTHSLIGRLEWTGLAGIDFRTDADTGRHVLLEMNGRPWAPMGAASALGFDFTTAAANLVLNGTAPSFPVEYPAGRRFRYRAGVIRALSTIARQRGVGQAFSAWKASRGGRTESPGLSDPWPGLAEARENLMLVLDLLRGGR